MKKKIFTSMALWIIVVFFLSWSVAAEEAATSAAPAPAAVPPAAAAPASPPAAVPAVPAPPAAPAPSATPPAAPPVPPAAAPAPEPKLPTTPPPREGEPSTSPTSSQAAGCSGCIKLPGDYYIPSSERGNILTSSGTYQPNVIILKNGNLRGTDNSLYSQNGLVKVDNSGNVKRLKDDSSEYEKVEGMTILTPAISVRGPLSLVGGQPVVPLKDNLVNVGGVVIDGQTFQRMEALVGSLTITKKDDKLIFGSSEISSTEKDNVRTTILTVKEGPTNVEIPERSGTVWTLADGTTLSRTEDMEQNTVILGDEVYYTEDNFAGTGKLYGDQDKNDLQGKISVKDNILTTEGKFFGERWIKTEKNIQNNAQTQTEWDGSGKSIVRRRETNQNGQFEEKQFAEGTCKDIDQLASCKVIDRQWFDEKGLQQTNVFKDDGTPQFTRHLDSKSHRVLAISYPQQGGTFAKDAEGKLGRWNDANNDGKIDAGEVAVLNDEQLDRLKERGIDPETDFRRFGPPAGWSGLLLLPDALGRRYDALTDLLGLGRMDWMKDAERTFARLRGKEFFGSPICENIVDFVPSEHGMVTTPSGITHAVASIQAEKSANKVILLCDAEGKCPKEEYTCQQEICYDKNEKPVQAYFYKITWGVKAPGDIELTPLRDEEGGKIRFNVRLGDHWLYEFEGQREGAITLKNGESDRDARVYYSSNSGISKACLVWKDAPLSLNGDSLSDICDEDISVSSVGQVNWETSGKESSEPSHSVSGGQVQARTGFLE